MQLNLSSLDKIKVILFSNIRIGRKINIPFPVFVWFLLPTIAVVAELLHHKINNYSIYKYVFWHTVEKTNLYLQYPGQFEDANHYGPFFSIIIAPFAILPDAVGVILWVWANTWFLYYAIRQLPISLKAKYIILLVAAIELMTASHNVQFNPMMAAWIILSYTFVKKGNDFWATFFIAAGFLVKIYGITGLLFFLFSKNKSKFTGSFLFWMVALICLPMVISSPSFIFQSYIDWKDSLVLKNTLNAVLGNMQDISVPGMIRRFFVYQDLSMAAVLLPAGLLFCLPLLRFSLYQNKVYQLYYLALTLITVVIFSSSAESPTYIIALCGVGIWFVLNAHHNKTSDKLLLGFVLLLTSLSPTDLFPRYIRNNFIIPYSLKALPCFVIWIVLIMKLTFQKSESLDYKEVL